MDSPATEGPPVQVSATSVSEGVVRSAGVTSFAVLLSRLSGLVREGAMSRLFGAGTAFDAFVVGFRIPNLTRDLFAEGALSSAFVPTFVDSLKHKSREEAAELANNVASAIILVVGALCIAGMVFSPWIVGMVTGTWERTEPAKYELAVLLTRIMFPFLLLVSLAAQAMGILNACGQFAIPAFSSTMFNVGSVISGVAIGFWVCPRFGLPPIVGMGFGVVIGGLLQLLWQVPSLRRQGFRFRFHIDWESEELRTIAKLMGPAILGNAAIQINVLVNTYFATSIYDPVRGYNGPASWLSYAFRFMQLPLGLFGVAIATATLPAISKSAASKNVDEFRDTLARSLGLVFVLTVPASVGLMIMGRSIVGLIYQGAKFGSYDTERTAQALAFYAVGLAGYAAVKVLTPAFYTLNDSRTPMVTSLVSVAVNVGAASLLLRRTNLGTAGLALATSLVALCSFLILFLAMRRKIGRVYGRRLRDTILKVTAASAVMGVAVWGIGRILAQVVHRQELFYVANVLVSIPAGLLVLYLACRILRIDELDLATRALAGPIARRLGR